MGGTTKNVAIKVTFPSVLFNLLPVTSFFIGRRIKSVQRTETPVLLVKTGCKGWKAETNKPKKQ